MFGLKSKVTLDAKSLSKRINRQLVANFFTINEFKELSDKQAFKVIKLISNIENVKLTRSEIKEVVNFIKHDFDTESVESSTKLWDFVVEHVIEKMIERAAKIIFEDQIHINNYRYDKYDLLRM